MALEKQYLLVVRSKCWNRVLPEGGDGANPLSQKLPIAPIFIADKVSLAVSREKEGNCT